MTEKNNKEKKSFVQISPSLSYPISHIPANDQSLFDTNIKYNNESMKITDSVDRSSELSSYSFSSSVSQETPSTRNYLQSNVII